MLSHLDQQSIPALEAWFPCIAAFWTMCATPETLLATHALQACTSPSALQTAYC